MPANNLSIADALFTKTQQRVLGLIYGHTDQSYYLNELVRLAGVGKGTVNRELNNLVSAGLVSLNKLGNQHHYQANPECPVFEELKAIIKKTSGLVDVLRDALQPVLSTLDLAFIYGSMAKGSEHSLSDIDILLVGDALDYAAILDCLMPAATELGREIHPTLLSVNELESRIANNQSFATRILEQDKLWIAGEDKLKRYKSETS